MSDQGLNRFEPTIRLIYEHCVSHEITDQLRGLLDTSFPDTFDGRIYFKQRPHFRLVAFDGDKIVGQVGVDFRAIRVGAGVLDIFGLIDLCVDHSRHGRGIGSRLLREAESHAAKADIDFLLLMADRQELYARNGYYQPSSTLARWLAIEDRQSVTVIERDLANRLMIKPVRGVQWPEGMVDLLGYLF